MASARGPDPADGHKPEQLAEGVVDYALYLLHRQIVGVTSVVDVTEDGTPKRG